MLLDVQIGLSVRLGTVKPHHTLSMPLDAQIGEPVRLGVTYHTQTIIAFDLVFLVIHRRFGRVRLLYNLLKAFKRLLGGL